LDELYDLTIIGGGPAGLYAAFYSGMRDMKTKIIEANDELGGVLRTFPEKMIWDVGGTTPIRGEELIRRTIEQSQTFQPTIALGQKITNFERLEDGTIRLYTETGEQHHTKTVLLAVGYGIPKPVKLELEGVERFEVNNLFYTVTQMDYFRNKRVLISGGGDTAVDWANELEGIAAEVTIVHRRNQFGGHEQPVKQMLESSVRVYTPHTISGLHANAAGDAIEYVTISRLDENGEMENEKERIVVDAVIVNHGTRSDWGDLGGWEMDRGEWNKFKVNDRMETSLPGFYCAGDAAGYVAKIGLIATAFSDSIIAVNQAKAYIDPTAKRMASVSSHSDVFYEWNKALQENK